MATNRVRTTASPGNVFAVLSDPCKYADWVIGARRVRDADASWPAVGARFHHALGAGPIELKDVTEVTECKPPTHLVLRAAFRPAGEACIDLTIEGRATSTVITLREWPVTGPARRWQGLMLEMATRARNTFALRRLRRLSEQISHPHEGPMTPTSHTFSRRRSR